MFVHCLIDCAGRVLYSTANDPETTNDPQNGPQIILDRK